MFIGTLLAVLIGSYGFVALTALAENPSTAAKRVWTINLIAGVCWIVAASAIFLLPCSLAVEVHGPWLAPSTDSSMTGWLDVLLAVVLGIAGIVVTWAWAILVQIANNAVRRRSGREQRPILYRFRAS
jgi:hypothetical protein